MGRAHCIRMQKHRHALRKSFNLSLASALTKPDPGTDVPSSEITFGVPPTMTPAAPTREAPSPPPPPAARVEEKDVGIWGCENKKRVSGAGADLGTGGEKEKSHDWDDDRPITIADLANAPLYCKMKMSERMPPAAPPSASQSPAPKSHPGPRQPNPIPAPNPDPSTATISAIQSTLSRLQLEATGKAAKELKSAAKEEKKARGRNFNCPGPETCGNAFCKHRGWPRKPVGASNNSRQPLDRTLELLIQTSSDRDYPVSENYAMDFLVKNNNKIVPALAAIKNDLDTREAALEATGRVSYAREIPIASNSPNTNEVTRDMMIRFMEDDDIQFKELSAKGWESGYGKVVRGYRGTDKDKWWKVYSAEAKYRNEREVYYKENARKAAAGLLDKKEFEELMRKFDGLEEGCSCETGGGLEEVETKEEEGVDEVPGMRGRGIMLAHLRHSPASPTSPGNAVVTQTTSTATAAISIPRVAKIETVPEDLGCESKDEIEPSSAKNMPRCPGEAGQYNDTEDDDRGALQRHLADREMLALRRHLAGPAFNGMSDGSYARLLISAKKTVTQSNLTKEQERVVDGWWSDDTSASPAQEADRAEFKRLLTQPIDGLSEEGIQAHTKAIADLCLRVTGVDVLQGRLIAGDEPPGIEAPLGGSTARVGEVAPKRAKPRRVAESLFKTMARAKVEDKRKRQLERREHGLDEHGWGAACAGGDRGRMHPDPSLETAALLTSLDKIVDRAQEQNKRVQVFGGGDRGFVERGANAAEEADEADEGDLDEKVESYLEMPLDHETVRLHQRLFQLVEDIIGDVHEDGPFDGDSIGHVKEQCDIEQDTWASSYICLAGGSAALAVAFCTAGHAEMKEYLTRRGVRRITNEHLETEAIRFAINFYYERHRRSVAEGHVSCEQCSGLGGGGGGVGGGVGGLS